MGTNYTARTNQCDCCKRYDEFHIGKSLTMFRGYTQPDYSDEQPTPWGEITSWQDWKRALTTTPGIQVFDEDGVEHKPQRFVERVEATNPSARGRQMRWLIDHEYPLDHDWVDAEGFDFHDGEFS
jgi:hypothetical protein